MHILFTDETNMRPSGDARFFIYGGLIFAVGQLVTLDQQVSDIRRSTGFADGDHLKFALNSRPAQVTADAHTEAKRRVIQACQEIGAKFIVNVIHHEVIIDRCINNAMASAKKGEAPICGCIREGGEATASTPP